MFAALFPGQGAQKVGMAESVLGSNSECFLDEASDVLGVNVKHLVVSGSEEQLLDTTISQGIIFAVSYSLWHLKHEQWGIPSCYIGHSLGQLTAAAAAGALRFSDAMFLAGQRGRLMASAYPTGGGMLAVLGLDEKVIGEICKASLPLGWIQPANFNGPGQIILSGEISALEHAAILATELGARRTVRLKVSGPFHSQLMEPAAKEFGTLLDGVELADPTAPLISNVNGSLLQDSQSIRHELVLQITSAVRWTDAILAAQALGVNSFVEFSSTAVVGPITKRIGKGAKISLA